MRDLDHEVKINDFIRAAMRMADEEVERTGAKPYKIMVRGESCLQYPWNTYFHRAMNKLTKAAGLRV